MTQKEKTFLLKDLCMRLPYGVKVYGNYAYSDGEKIVDDKKVEILNLSKLDWFLNEIEIKPYLRPISSMTEEEKKTYPMFFNEDGLLNTSLDTYLEWLLEGHFDFKGLIPRGLALEAPEGMYNIPFHGKNR